jgi:hypothetical protein
MDNTRLIREQARQALLARNARPQSEDEPRESILVRDGRYCGRSFRMGNAVAVWLCDRDHLSIYSPENPVVDHVPIETGSATQNKAA